MRRIFAFAALSMACAHNVEAAAPSREIMIENRGSEPIVGVYSFPGNTGQFWGANMLATRGSIPAGGNVPMILGVEGLHNLTVDCQFDIKVELANGKQFAEPGVNVCKGGKWTISDGDDDLHLDGANATGLTNHDYRRICSAELQRVADQELAAHEDRLRNLLARSGKEGALQELQIQAGIESTRPEIEDLRHGGVNSAEIVESSDETGWLAERQRIKMSNSPAEMRKLITMHRERGRDPELAAESAFAVCELQAYIRSLQIKR